MIQIHRGELFPQSRPVVDCIRNQKQIHLGLSILPFFADTLNVDAHSGSDENTCATPGSGAG